MTIRLSVLDQSLARAADQAPVALQETLQMARWCEQFPQQALAQSLGPQERAFIASRENSRAVGTPGQVAEQIARLVARYGADEVMAVTNMYYLEDHKRSFELLADACGG